MGAGRGCGGGAGGDTVGDRDGDAGRERESESGVLVGVWKGFKFCGPGLSTKAGNRCDRDDPCSG